MARNPERRRPGGQSVLVPLVEQLNMPVNEAPVEPVAVAEPVATTPDETARVEATTPPTVPAPDLATPVVAVAQEAEPQVPVEKPESAEAGAAESAPAVLVPQAEPVVEPADPVQGNTPAAEAAPVPETTPAQIPAPEPVVYIPPNMKQPVTINMRTSLKLRAETAVLRTNHLPGGYRSQVMLIEAALEKELERLEAAFNNGEPFPPNVGSFRTGRPLGS